MQRYYFTDYFQRFVSNDAKYQITDNKQEQPEIRVKRCRKTKQLQNLKYAKTNKNTVYIS